MIISNDIVDKFNNRYAPSENGCWIWTSSKQNKGYGVIRYENKSIYAHRLSWIIDNQKPIPDGMCICHKCDNPACVNPQHLFLGTYKDNLDDMRRKSRGFWRRGENHQRSKMTHQQINEIRFKYDNRISTKAQLAREYHVHHTWIAKIVRREVWIDKVD